MPSSWAFGLAVPLTWIAACGSTRSTNGFGPGDDGGPGSPGEDGGSEDSGVVFFPPPDDAALMLTTDVNNMIGGASPCKGGGYDGAFAGTYNSHLIIGLPLTVTGNVDLTLHQEGTGQEMCMLAGESTVCSDLFSLQDGTITGVANGDDSGGGYPYFCTMTGTLDCAEKKLVNGWIECTYCVGPLADGGMACALGNLGGTSGITMGVGGQFAGPLTANYDTTTLSFVGGTWSGAEALAGHDGGPLNGKPAASYLSDAGYGIGNYGGEGTWNATYK